MQAHLSLRGNAYSEIVYNGFGRPAQLWPLHPDKMKAEWGPAAQLIYKYKMPDGKDIILDPANVLHLRIFSPDGLHGRSPITHARESIGLAIAAESFGSKLFANGARPSGVFKLPGALSPEAYDRLKDQLRGQYGGLNNAARIMILEQGLDWSSISIDPDDAQFLETRKYQRSEIAAIFRVPPHMIGDLEKATYSNIEQQSLDFAIFTLTPYLRKWEQRLSLSLLTEAERATYYFKFNMSGLLRGDNLSRSQAYATGQQNGWLSVNDIREMEDMNPIEKGDVYLFPMNMAPRDQIGKIQPQANAPQPGDVKRATCTCGQEHRDEMPQTEIRVAPGYDWRSRQKTAESFEILFQEAAARVVRREAEQIRKAMKKHMATRDLMGFQNWMDEFYTNFPDFVQKQFMPVLTSLSTLIFAQASKEVGPEAEAQANKILTEENGRCLPENVDKYAKVMAKQHVELSRNQLNQVMAENRDNPEQAIEQRISEWEDTRPDKIAQNETVRYTNYIAKIAFIAAGVKYLRWHTAGGDNCPYCKAMNNVIVGIREAFAAAGMDVGGLQIKSNVHYPPLHGGCKCGISPE